MTELPVQSATMSASRHPISLRHVFGLTFLLAPSVAAVSPLGVAPVFTVVTLAALAAYAIKHRAWPAIDRRILVVSLLFVGWMGLTLLWTVAMPETLRFLPRAAFYVLAGVSLVGAAYALPAGDREIVSRYLIIGVLLGAAMLVVEVFCEGAVASGIHQLFKGEPRAFDGGSLNRGASYLAIFAFPVALAVRRQFGWPAALAILGLLAVTTYTVQGNKATLGMIAGATALIGSLVLGRLLVPLLAAAVVVLFLAVPLQSSLLSHVMPVDFKPARNSSVPHRLMIWEFVTERIAERPLTGWGLNSSRALPDPQRDARTGSELLPLHPHNAPMQFWLELGGIGAAILSVLIALGIMTLRRIFPDRTDIGFAAATIASTVSIAAVGYGAWQGWWLGTIWLSLAALAALATVKPDSR